MKSIVESLLELQSLLLPVPAKEAAATERVRRLRAQVPGALLGHFDRMTGRGRRAVAMVRHGVCGECHMRLPSGVAAGLAATDSLVMCETCSCFLLLSPQDAEAQRRAREEAKARWARNARPATAGV